MKPRTPHPLSLVALALTLAGCGGGPNLFNAGPGSSSSTTSSTSSGSTVTPAIVSVSPSNEAAGATNQTLTITGNNFETGATVTFNSEPQTITTLSATAISVTIANTNLESGGIYALTVTNPGGGSASVEYDVVNPPPVLTSLSPASVAAGSNPLTLTMTGTGFNPSTTVTFGSSSPIVTYISPTELSIVVNAGELATAAVVPVVVTNPAPGGGPTAPIDFQIDNPPPVITGFSPTSAIAGSGGETLTIDGTGFNTDSTVSWNGSSQTATYISPTQLTINVSASELASGGEESVTVTNPTPGGGTSAPANFPIDNPVPAITSLSPTSMLLDTDTAVTISGSNFVTGATVNFTIGGNTYSLTPSSIASDQIIVTVPGADATAAGTDFSLAAVNPNPGGGTSAPAVFAVDYPPPVFSSMLPVSAPQNPPYPVTVTLGGSGFNAGTSVTFNGAAITPTVLQSTQMTITLPSSALQQVGVFPVTVSNPTPGGGSSNTLFFSVGEPSASSAGIAVIQEEVQQVAGGPQTLDVAYLPMPPPPGGTQSEIDIVQLDTIDVPPYLPVNGFVTNAAPYSTPGTLYSTFINPPNTASGTAVLNRILLPANYTPNATVADTADCQILVSSVTSAEILTISTASPCSSPTTPIDPSVQSITGNYTLAGITGSIEFSDYLCSGVCDLTVDQSGIAAQAGAWAMTPNGLLQFNPVSGQSLAAMNTNVTPGPEFGYSSSATAWNLLNPFYTPSGEPGLQFVNLAGGGSVTNLTNSVGTRPTSGVIDLGTQFGLIADEGTGVDTLLNLIVPPSGSYATPPGVNFYIGTGGENCQTRPDWTMTSVDPNTHILLSAQIYAGCLAATQLPTSPLLNGSQAGTPTIPTPTLFGPVTAPQGPYTTTPPWGSTAQPAPEITLDPDALAWNNGPDPFRFAVYTSVLTGQPTALLLEPQAASNASCTASVPGVWLAETPLPAMLDAAGASGVGELTPASMAELSTFIRVRVPTPAVCSPSVIVDDQNVTVINGETVAATVTFNGAGFVSGTTISWDGTPLQITTQTPTALTVYLTATELTVGTHTITVSTSATAYGSIGGSTSFTVTVIPPPS